MASVSENHRASALDCNYWTCPISNSNPPLKSGFLSDTQQFLLRMPAHAVQTVSYANFAKCMSPKTYVSCGFSDTY